MPARRSAGEIRRDAAVALAERAVQPLASSSLHGMTFAWRRAGGSREAEGKMQNGAPAQGNDGVSEDGDGDGDGV